MPTPTPTAARPAKTMSSGVSRSSVDSTPKPATRITVPATICALSLPVRLTIWPDTVDDTSVPSIIGIISNPASVGLYPRLTWKYWPRNTAPPNMAIPTARLARIASAGAGCLITASGSTGSATRDSHHTATARITSAAPTMAAVCHDTQSKEESTKVTQISSRLTPAARSVAPT